MKREIAASLPEERPAGVEVVRRAWVVELGPLRIASARNVWRGGASYRAAGDHRAARLWRPAAIALAGVAIAALVVDVASTRATAMTGYAVLQPVPAAAPPAPPRRRHARHRPAPAPAPSATDSPDADPALATSPGEREAIAAAWASGDAQDWSANGSHGVIVPGPLERGDGMACRAFSRLTRREGAEDSIEQWRRCSPTDDAGR